MQISGRANRRGTHDGSGTGTVVAVVQYSNYQLNVGRGRMLQGSQHDKREQQLGLKIVADTNALFQLMLQQGCIQQRLDQHLDGAGAPFQECGNREGDGVCCNCRRRAAARKEWTRVEELLPNAAETNVPTRNREIKSVEKILKAERCFVPPRNGYKRPVVQGTTVKFKPFAGNSQPDIASLEIDVMASNRVLTSLLRRSVLQLLGVSCKYGMKIAALVEAVARSTGKFGLSEGVVRWCLWWFMVNNILEEQPDASPSPPGFERTGSVAQHVILVYPGAAASEWPTAEIHERLGFFAKD